MFNGKITLIAVAEQFPLTGKTIDSYYGSWGGYPIAVTNLGSEGEFGLLFQIRHHVPIESLPDQDALDWGAELNRLIDEKKAKVEVEDRLAWLSLYEADSAFQRGVVQELVGAVLSGLATGGIESLGDTCHYCFTNSVDVIRYEQGRVAQICDGCLAGRREIQTQQKQLSAAGFLATCSVGLLVSPLGAVAWAACWIAYLWVFELVWGGKDYVMVPIFVSIGQVIVFGSLTGLAIGWAISKIPKRGYHSAGLIAAASAFGAVLLGEVLLGLWIAYYVIGEMSVVNVLCGRPLARGRVGSVHACCGSSGQSCGCPRGGPSKGRSAGLVRKRGATERLSRWFAGQQPIRLSPFGPATYQALTAR